MSLQEILGMQAHARNRDSRLLRVEQIVVELSNAGFREREIERSLSGTFSFPSGKWVALPCLPPPLRPSPAAASPVGEPPRALPRRRRNPSNLIRRAPLAAAACAASARRPVCLGGA